LPLDEETRNPPREASDASCGPAAAAWLELSEFDNSDYDPGRGIVVRTLWYFCSVALFESGWLPVSGLKIRLLRLFGASVGAGVVIKPNVRIKFPWRLKVGDHCWIGQEVWIDNLDDVEIGDNVCISQLCYLCTGSHDHRQRTFDLIIRPIRIGAGAWLGARCTILQGVTVGCNALVAGGAVVNKNVDHAAIVAGNPASPVGKRQEPVR
jgi:putative colanic acid biosynthesis acetyltransferase WcaF